MQGINSPKEAAPLVYVIILNWNRYETIRICLDSLAKLSYPNARILIVDNGSSDGSLEKLKQQYAYCEFLENKENLGYTGGNNRGIELALNKGAQYIWLLNNDCHYETDVLPSLIQTMEMNERIGLLSPIIKYHARKKIMHYYGTYIPQDIRDKHPLHTLAQYEEAKTRPLGSLVLWGTALLLRSSCVKKIGLLENAFFAYHEDIEYGLRSLKFNFTNEIDTQSVVHHGSLDFTVEHYSPLWYYYNLRNEFIFEKVTGSRLKLSPALKAKVLISVLKKLGNAKRFGNPKLLKGGTEGIIAGLLGHSGPRRDIHPLWLLLFYPLRAHPFAFALLLEVLFPKPN